MNVTSDLRMVLYQLSRLADQLDHAGKTQQALRLRAIASEIRRLGVDELCADIRE